jgi:hypothetical protein
MLLSFFSHLNEAIGSPFVLSTPMAARALEILFAWSASIQIFEYLRMSHAMHGSGLWVWRLQRADIPNAALRQLFDALYAEPVFKVLLWARLLALVSLALQGSGLINVVFLFITHVLVLIRWRGAFNGGSDFMTLVVLTGLLLAQLILNVTEGSLTDADLAWRACFWYIAIQSITSYFVSGSVKLLRPEWRKGQALTIFLNAAIHGPLPEKHLLRQTWMATLASWGFILWECAAPLVLLDARWAVLFCLMAALFHFLVFWFFGLNRFFWAWLASFPAIVWCAGQY